MRLLRPPLRTAFWAISAALMLMLMLALSDPHRVRESLLSMRSQTAAEPAVTRLGGNEDDGTEPTPILAAAGSVATQTPVRGKPKDPSPVVSPTLAVTNVRSPSDDPEPTPATKLTEDRLIQPAMPILTPSSLHGEHAPGVFVELPPPPGMGLETESGPASESTLPGMGIHAEISSSAPRELVAEFRELQRDVRRLEQRQAEKHLSMLYERQAELLKQQQKAAGRLRRLARQLESHLDRIARIDPERDATSSAVPARVPPPLDPVSQGDSQLHTLKTPNGSERFYLVIESENVSDVIERLASWSQDASEPDPPSEAALPNVEPRPQYIVPPPREAFPAAARRESPVSLNSTPGPHFAAPQTPCRCR